PEDSEWRKIVSVDLDNAMGDCPADRVGVVTLWTWPDPMEQLTVADLRAAQTAVSKDGPWRKDVRANNWVGKPIAAALCLDLNSKADVAKVKGALKIWIENGMFKEVSGQDDTRRDRTFIEVGTWANDGETVRMKPSSRKPKNKDKFQPVIVDSAPDGVACVLCQTVSDQQVFKIRDGRVPYGQPGGKPECLHKDCAEKWFTGQFHP